MMATLKLLTRILFYGSFLLFVGIKAVEAYKNRGVFNGFEVTGSLIPTEQIHQGGPPRDGIPAIDEPEFVKASEAENINPDSRILGLYLNNQARAYPISILNWHEIVNDQFQQTNVTITYCPLCGTGMAFESKDTEGFGVSGLLYNSDMLLYDRKTESLWSQIMKTAVSGPRKTEKLTALPLMHTDWQSWKIKHPDTLLLSRKTGFRRDYDKSPYIGYDTTESLYFPVKHQDTRYPKKESIIGLVLDGHQKVWPFSELKKASVPLTDKIGPHNVTVHYNDEKDHAWVTDQQGELLAAVRGYWFAWMAFHPDSQVFTSN